jgi:hypothetical protein
MQFSPAAALWENREKLTDTMPEIAAVRETLQTVMGGPRDFVRQQWLQLVSVVYDFKPDLIIELGRGYGNSTCAMSVAMKMLRPRPCRLLSLCMATAFAEISRPHLDINLEDKSLFSSLEALNADIMSYDFSADVAKAERIFIFWDAHGYDLAVTLLGRLFPTLVAKAHLVVVHDMADLSYFGDEYRRYDSDSLWKSAGSAPCKYILGDVGSQFEEGIALVDFLGRNGLAFRSAESSYFEDLIEPQVVELERRFGADFSRFGFWYHFSLNDATDRPLTFPPLPEAVSPQPNVSHSGAPSTKPPSAEPPKKKRSRKKRRSLLKRLFSR